MLKVLRVSAYTCIYYAYKIKTVHAILVLFLSLRLSAPILIPCYWFRAQKFYDSLISLSLMKLLDACRKGTIN